MCTAIIGVGPDGTVLLAGVRDEFVQRAWQPPGHHWADRPGQPGQPALSGLIGGRDERAGGTWLALEPAVPRVACILNGRGRAAPAATRRSRGELPLRAAAGDPIVTAEPTSPTDPTDPSGLAAFDPFRLLVAEPGRVQLLDWDGEEFRRRDLAPGLHLVVNSGLAGELRPDAGQHEIERLGYYQPRLAAIPLPQPKPGASIEDAWAGWLPLLNGAGLAPDDPRALIVRREFDDGRVWGTTSISLIALTPDGIRYDFTAAPGDPAAWYPVPLEPGPLG
ncbi:MAG TPA: NRDE family protein [Streptosporangiaceae bacterium]|nr:NRDE family protein [Streptosporangiaceae bacterium]